MKQKNLDFVIDEIVSLAKIAFVGSNDRVDFDWKLRRLIQDEYKYLLRGPK